MLVFIFCLVSSLYYLVRTFTQDYIKNYDSSIHISNNLVSGSNLYALPIEPYRRAKTYTTSTVGCVQYHTKARETNRKTQNRGIMTTGSHKDIAKIEFYGSLRDIIELWYNSGLVLTVDFGTPSYEFTINICMYLIF
jgi:hypothetical protein